MNPRRRVTARTRQAAGALLAFLTYAAASGCGDSCEDLQVICDSCQDPNQRASCERSVDEGVQDVCEQDVDSFGDICR